MAWRDRLKPASFRGLPFLFEEDGREGGRRLVELAGPGIDGSDFQDMGRRGRALRVRAIIHGEDFDLAADAFEEALNHPDGGDLVLPTKGSSALLVEQYLRLESVREGAGIATFDIVFREAPPAQRAQIDEGDLVEDRAAALEDAAGTAVEDGVTSSAVPQWVRDATAGAVEAVGEVIDGLRLLQAKQSEVLRLQSKVLGMISTAAELATAPVTLAATVLDAVRQVRAAGMNGVDALYAYRQFFGMNPGLTGATSRLGVIADRNRLLVTHLARAAAVAGAVRSGAEAEFESEEQAEDARGAIDAEIDALDDDADDSTYAALQDLRVELRRSVPRPDLRPPATFLVTPAGPVPALVLASRYLDDALAAERIARANRIRNPLFVPAVELRIVGRG